MFLIREGWITDAYYRDDDLKGKRLRIHTPIVQEGHGENVEFVIKYWYNYDNQ